MSPSPIDNLPLGTQAAILRAVANARWSHDKPAIASRYSITLADLQTLVWRHGVDDKTLLLAAAARLEADEQAETDERDHWHEEAGEAGIFGSQDIADALGGDGPVSRETSADDGPDPGTRQRLVRVRVDQLRADPNNLRENIARRVNDDELDASHGALDDIDQLAESIRESGLHQPIVVREAPALSSSAGVDLYMVVMGHRRLAAIRRLKWTAVEVIVRPPMRPDEVLAAMLIENGQRAGLDPIEEARGIRQLGTMHGWTDEHTARKIGRSKSYVSMRLALLELDPAEQERVRAGDMGVTAGANLGRLKSGRTQQSHKRHRTVDYFGPTNDLAGRARARCQRMQAGGNHPAKMIAGGEACGGCWESVIRADERNHLQTANATADDCVVCGSPLDHATPELVAP